MFQIDEIDFSFLKQKKVLILSDTGFPYPYITQFISQLSESQVYIYICPATTSRFVQLWVKMQLNKKVNIIKDKHYKMFFKKEIDDYEIVLFFGKEKTEEGSLLRKLLKSMILSYKNITIVTEKGIDCDENYTLQR
jgi:hypothetical protein